MTWIISKPTSAEDSEAPPLRRVVAAEFDDRSLRAVGHDVVVVGARIVGAVEEGLELERCS